jgi:hypothetical protein
MAKPTIRLVMLDVDIDGERWTCPDDDPLEDFACVQATYFLNHPQREMVKARDYAITRAKQYLPLLVKRFPGSRIVVKVNDDEAADGNIFTIETKS